MFNYANLLKLQRHASALIVFLFQTAIIKQGE